MAFPEDVVKDAWELVEGHCECSNPLHHHEDNRCNKRILWEMRGKIGHGAWEACPIDGKAEHNTLSNCQIICWECKNA